MSELKITSGIHECGLVSAEPAVPAVFSGDNATTDLLSTAS
jgi:hypothetical protein